MPLHVCLADVVPCFDGRTATGRPLTFTGCTLSVSTRHEAAVLLSKGVNSPHWDQLAFLAVDSNPMVLEAEMGVNLHLRHMTGRAIGGGNILGVPII